MNDPVDPKSWGTTHDPLRQFKNQIVRLTDLIGFEPILSGIRFENCRLLGPALIALVDSPMKDSFIHGSWDQLIWEFSSKDRPVVTGVLVLDRCELVRCELSQIGFAVERDTEIVTYMQGLKTIDRPLP